MSDEEEETEIAVAPDPARARKNPPQSVTLDSFIRNRFGEKHLDQAAGFVKWARHSGIRRKTTREWNDLHDQFVSLPVG